MPVISTRAAASSRGWGMFGVRSPGYRLFVSGINQFGQLGLGDTTGRSSPVQVGNYLWKDVSSGATHTIAVRQDGSLWGWGRNHVGQLGLGDTTDRSSPTQMGTETNWMFVFCSNATSFAIKNNGTLWSWGWDGRGVLGNGGADTSISSPVQIGALTDWGSAAWGNRGHGAVGYDLVGVIKPNGSLWQWGGNRNGPVGNGTASNYYGVSSPVQISVGSTWNSISHTSSGVDATSIGIRSDGTLWTWGQNWKGSLANGFDTYGTRYAPGQVGSITNWRVASGGVTSSASFAIRSNGTVFGWGKGYHTGALGYGTTSTSYIPINVNGSTDWSYTSQDKISTGNSFTVVIKQNGTLWGWGQNNNGQLGVGDTTNRSSPVQVGTLFDWVKVAASQDNISALRR